MKYDNPLDYCCIKQSIHPNSGAAATINGTSIVRGRGRSMLVVLSTGTIVNGGTLDVKVQYKDAAGNWQNLQSTDSGVATDVKFTQKLTGDSDKTFEGWLPVAELPWDEYRAVGTAAVQLAPYSVNFYHCDFPAVPVEDSGETANVNAFAAIVGVAARAGALSP